MPGNAIVSITVVLNGNAVERGAELCFHATLDVRQILWNRFVRRKSRDQTWDRDRVVVHPHRFLRPGELRFELFEERGAFHGIEERGIVHDGALIVDEHLRGGSEQANLLRHTVKNPDMPAAVANSAIVQIRVLAVGKMRERYAAQACAEFEKRLRPYYPVEIIEVKASDGSQPVNAMREEAERISKHVHEDDCVWLLDRTGDELSSEQLSRMISAVGNEGTRRLTFVISGTYGAADSLRERADFVWSLSALTFLHEWARMIVLEQVYRAAKIARNEPYHH